MNLEERIISKSKLMVDPVETNNELEQVITIHDALVIAKEYAESMCKRQIALVVAEIRDKLFMDEDELKTILETTPLATEEK
jgi:hypothetical protein